MPRRKFFNSQPIKRSATRGVAPIPANACCRRCRKKWRQDSSGLCRACARECGDTKTNFQREAEAVALRNATLTSLRVQIHQPIETRIVGGVEYDVVFNGRWR